MTTAYPKSALVTGGARRIGRCIALALAKRGWDVVVHYGQSEADALAVVKEITDSGRRAAAVQCDLADEAAVKTLLARANHAMGPRSDSAPISCVVNNASKFEQDEVADFSMASMEAHLRPNLAAPILLAQALHGATPVGRQSVVINLLDQKLFNQNPDFFIYTLSKAALHSATTMLAQALAPTVRVVGVAPGFTTFPTDTALAQTLPGHANTADDIAATVCFLAESPTITGTTILVDGGQHLLPPPRDPMPSAK